jgi:Zn-dependent protease with chaperone function
MALMSPVSEPQPAMLPGPGGVAPGFYFDGTSSMRHAVVLRLGDRLEILLDDLIVAAWSYAGIRRADSAHGTLRVSCLTAPVLARLEIRDGAAAAELIARCPQLDANTIGKRGGAKIVGWSMAAIASIVAMVLVGMPLLADRLTPLLPERFERHLGAIADGQVRTVLGGKVCNAPAGQAAFEKLVNAVRAGAMMEGAVDPVVLASPMPNALALPGGRIYLLKGLLAKAENADEIAGVFAHELGHLKHRDGTRNLIHDGGTSFLIGLLFGDVSGSGALIFASRTLVSSSYSRDAERGADSFAIAVMHRLGRSPKPMGELLFRVTGKEGGSGLSIVSSHPLTEDRLARMDKEDAPPSGPALLSAAEWTALKEICDQTHAVAPASSWSKVSRRANSPKRGRLA